MFKNGYALLIGVSDYLDQTIQPLPQVKEDIKAIRAVLLDTNLCSYNPNNLNTVTGNAADKANIIDALKKLALATNEKSTVFLYFSGHGGQAQDFSWCLANCFMHLGY